MMVFIRSNLCFSVLAGDSSLAPVVFWDRRVFPHPPWSFTAFIICEHQEKYKMKMLWRAFAPASCPRLLNYRSAPDSLYHAWRVIKGFAGCGWLKVTR
jgi:hypothetical protein